MENEINNLEELNKELNAILDTYPDLIFIIADDETYLDVYTNKPEELLIPKEKFIGLKMKDTLPENVYKQIKDAFYKSIKEDSLQIVKYTIDFDGKTKYFEARLKHFSEKVMCIVRDTTKEEELKLDIVKKNKFIDNITKQTPYFLYVYDLELNKSVFTNNKISDYYDIDDDNYDSLTIFNKLFHPDDLEDFIISRNNHLKANDDKPRSKEVRIKLKDKSYSWVKITNRIVNRNEENEPKQILGIVEDINERKLAENKIISNNNFINSVLELSPMLITIFDSFDYQVIYTNKRFDDITDSTKTEINEKANGYLSLLDEEDIYNFTKALNQLVSDKSNEQNLIYKLNYKNKSIWLETTLNIFTLSKNKVEIICISNDITEKIENQRKVKELEKRWEFALEGSGDGVWDWNAKTNKVFFSKQWKSMLGFEEHEVGDDLSEWDSRVHPDDKEEVYQKLNDHFEKKEDIYISQHRVLCKDGTYKWILDRGKVIERDEEDKPLRVIGTHTDIDELIETQEKLKESEQRFKNVIDAAGEYIWESDANSRYTFLSERFSNLLGYSIDEVIGKSPYDLMPKEDKKRLVERFFKVRKSKSKFTNETFRLYKKNGELVWHSINGRPIFDNDSKVIGYMGVGQDITDRIEREKELQNKTSYLELAEKTAKLGNWLVDLEANTLHWSDETKRIHEVPLDFVPNLETGINFYAPEVRQQVQDIVGKAIETGEGWDFELPLITAKGNRVWVHAIGEVIRENGISKKIFGTFQDITERKRIQSERDNIFNMSLDMISITGADAFFKELNYAWEINLEYTLEELKSKPLWDFILPEDIEKTQKAFVNVMSEPVINFENRYVAKSGKIVWLSWNAQTNQDDKLIYAITRNITHQKLQEEELQKAKNEAVLANKTKSTFLANMSHEIRTPMNSILGFGELLQNRVKDVESIKYIESMISAGKTLLTLINDILDLSKIEAGKLDIQKTNINIKSVIKEISDMYSILASKKNLNFSLNLSEEVPNKVYLDEVRLRQILLNILGNALKFTDKGEIAISVDYNHDSEQLKIDIKDTGIGIKESSLKSIFDEFKQQDDQLTRKYGGTGLGLAISKKLAKMMDGEISVVSELGSGSTFSVVLSNVVAHKSDIIEESDENVKLNFNEQSILIVDDNDLNLFLIETILKQLGNFKVIKSSNGQEAINSMNKNKIDIVFMDIHMPIMDGKTASIKIKNDLKLDIPIIALTALAMSHDIEEYSNYFDDYLVKPVEINKVKSVLKKYFKYDSEVIERISSEKSSSKLNSEYIELIKSQSEINIESLINSLEMDKIQEFANDLKEFGKEKEIDEIINYANELNDLCELFDIEEIIKKLKILK